MEMGSGNGKWGQILTSDIKLWKCVEIGSVEIGSVEIGSVEIGSVEIGSVEIGSNLDFRHQTISKFFQL